ncbi:glycosyltransferase family 4 protein [Acidovorax sp. sic0104]|uniref:glycosyltransferase family 4 protein n=1 Tax=Acidovorax sp. sic0104 TaxID=2854784 RepID=UPI001C446511|nr:glycosyltransferase family 4 protein [Acidovorax sp. sic0104]MBV7541535.1 glycosyltransferase family 4 protein [Acidovorax sp. sic0104]
MASERDRILIVTRNMPPLVGGMERLNWHIAHELSQCADVRLVAPAGAAAMGPASVAVTEVPLRPLRRFILASAWHAIRTAQAWKPQIVFAGSGLTAPAAWAAARICGARACIYLHGLDAAVKHPLYKAAWHPAIRNMDTVIANSRATAELASAMGVSPTKLRILHPGVHIPEESQPATALEAFRQRHGLGNSRVLLSIGRLTARKGLREFVQHALPSIVREAPDTILVVIGDVPADALHASVQSRDSIQSVANSAGVGQHLRFLGTITDSAELACAYECATLHVFPVRSLPHDPEGFGMVAIEAGAHGIPTVAFATGGVVDAVAEGRSGHLVIPDNYEAFARATLNLLNDNPTSWRPRTRTFAQGFGWSIFGQELRQILRA